MLSGQRKKPWRGQRFRRVISWGEPLLVDFVDPLILGIRHARRRDEIGHLKVQLYLKSQRLRGGVLLVNIRLNYGEYQQKSVRLHVYCVNAPAPPEKPWR